MTRRLLAFDLIRVIELRRRVRQAVERFERIASDEPAAGDAIATVRRMGHRLGTEWIAYLSRLAADTSMVDWSVDRNGDGELSCVRG